jgi:hypothetical protein
MALPTLGGAAPERLTLPDVRRLDRMPSLPEWVASPIKLIRDECQRSLNDGRYRTIPVLPANLILAPARRAELERYIAGLEALCEQTPAASAEWEGASLLIVTKLMLALPSSQQNEAGATASGEAFLVALDDVPTWAVEAAVRDWYRGECGRNELGQPYDYRWRPAPADLRRIAQDRRWRIAGLGAALRRLLEAEPLIEFSVEHCAEMRARLTGLVKLA